MGYITIMLVENNRSQTKFTLLYFKIEQTVQQLEVENNYFIFIIYICTPTQGCCINLFQLHIFASKYIINHFSAVSRLPRLRQYYFALACTEKKESPASQTDFYLASGRADTLNSFLSSNYILCLRCSTVCYTRGNSDLSAVGKLEFY